MQEDSKRTERQQKGAERWRYSSQYGADKNGRGVLEYVGGFGKTYLAVNFIIRPLLLKNKDAIVIILAPRKELVNQWNTEIDKFIEFGYHEQIIVQTISKCVADNLNLSCTLLVVDELHMAYGDEFINWINGKRIAFTYNLGLTATYRDKDQRYKKIEHLWPVIDKITTIEAKEKKFISNLTEYNFPIQMPPESIDEYLQYSNFIDAMMNKFGDFDTIKDIFNGKKNENGQYVPGYAYASQTAKNHRWYPGCSKDVDLEWNPQILREQAKAYFNAVHARRHLLYTHPLKIEYATKLIEKYPNLSTISFSQSTIFADTLAGNLRMKNIPVVVYHSQLESRPMVDKNGQLITYKSGPKKGQPKLFGAISLKNYAIEQIRSGAVKVISTAAALDVGFDVQRMRIGIVTSRTTDYNRQTQRGFRMSRIDPFEPDAECVIVNFFFPMTQDEKWLNSAQYGSNNPIKWISSIDEINLSNNDGIEF
jgi:superfamily II DNA or RNA helicase